MKKYVFSQIFAIPHKKSHTTISKFMIIQSKCHRKSHDKTFYCLNISKLSTLKNVTTNNLETSYILFPSQLCNIQRTLGFRVQR